MGDHLPTFAVDDQLVFSRLYVLSFDILEIYLYHIVKAFLWLRNKCSLFRFLECQDVFLEVFSFGQGSEALSSSVS